ncbi:hypothetical protein [Pseudomonas rubra]|uniref:HEAT repeat n=1 Tax=Pseudomonas rubra TaxID=2942627 RepID=A0ABT5PGC6_9PSED|nr:hypothetical protein [Pseudomonas rubra]MDD1017318.1 hypothetical protein [Pseudomonas rubra]MDD1039136.1 hypothetical protein [Pseudomonas rubra]MDD1156953.1 hypothetical protein [Pseudomonas rubra]
MLIAPVTLPITRSAFAAALRTGHGRVAQQIEQQGCSGFEDLIIEACLTCLAHDPQVEAERAPWLFSIIERAQLQEMVFEAIKAKGLAPSCEDRHDLNQRSALLKALAVAGMDNAKTLLYASLARMPDTADVIAADDIVTLDGVEGLIHVARQLGQWLQADADFWVDETLYGQFAAAPGAEQGLALLARAAASDADIARYLAEVRKTRESVTGCTPDASLAAYTASDIVAHLHNKPADPCHWFRGWGAQASGDQREAIFMALMKTEQPEHAKRLFKCFAKTGAPRFEQRLLRWVDQPDKSLRWAAVTALATVKHPELRKTAKHLMAGGDITNGIALLVKNFVEGDFSTCLEQLARLENPDELHRAVGQLLRLCEANPGNQALDCLLYVYEHSPCSTCRKQAVKALIDTNTAPGWLLLEAAFDVDPDTRALVAPER